MNQILSFDDSYKNNKKHNKNSNRNLVDIKKIVIFFAIALIIFGIVLIGKTVYNTFYNKNNSTENLSKPTVTLTKNEETGKLDIEIKHDAVINKILYSWNGGEQTEIDGRGRNFLTESVEIPDGTNKLKITVTDVKDVSVTYEKEYKTEKAQITLAQGNGGVNISVSSESEISYITYKWNETDEKKIDVNAKEYNTTIKVPQGENTLTVVAVDINENKTTEQKTIQGIVDEKPTIKVTIDDSNFIITAYDDEEIEKVIIRANGEDTTIEVGDKNFEYKVPFIEGYNEVRIKVYNINGLTETTKAILTK